jgi:hypothetical protein
MNLDKKPRLYLHIGSPKTGTTSFQYFLNENFEDLLKDFHLYYPFCDNDIYLPHHRLFSESKDFFSINEVRHNNGQRILAYQDPFSLISEISEVAKRKNVDVIISDESLSSTHPSSPFINELKKYFEVIPVIVIRDPLEFLFSAYLQIVKHFSYVGSFDDFIKAQKNGYQQLHFFENWFADFEQLKVIPFNKIKGGLIKGILESLPCSMEKLRCYSDKFSIKVNISHGTDFYKVIEILRGAGLLSLARKFSLICDSNPIIGNSQKPNPIYNEFALKLHGGLFEYLYDKLKFSSADFITTHSTPPPEVLGVNAISKEIIDLLVIAVKDTLSCVEDTGKVGIINFSTFPPQEKRLVSQRIALLHEQSSTWKKFCPAIFSPSDYLELNDLNDFWRPEISSEKDILMDPYRHYLMYGRYAGYAIKKCKSIEEQLAIYADSPFKGMMPKNFICKTYLLLNADVYSASVDPYHHFWAYGVKEGRIFCD